MQSADRDLPALPAWMKWIRALVMILLVASILAMFAVGYAAIRLVFQASSATSEWPSSIHLPDNAEPISITQTETGEQIVIYSDEEGYHAGWLNDQGEIEKDMNFQ